MAANMAKYLAYSVKVVNEMCDLSENLAQRKTL